MSSGDDRNDYDSRNSCRKECCSSDSSDDDYCSKYCEKGIFQNIENNCEKRFFNEIKNEPCCSGEKKKKRKLFKQLDKWDKKRKNQRIGELNEWARKRNVMFQPCYSSSQSTRESRGPPGEQGCRGPAGQKGEPGIAWVNSKMRTIPTKMTENGQYVILNDDESVYFDIEKSGMFIVTINIKWSLKFKSDPSILGRKYRVDFELFEYKKTEKDSKVSNDDRVPVLASINYSDNISISGGSIERTESCSKYLKFDKSKIQLSLCLRGFDFLLAEGETIIIEECDIHAIYLNS